MFVCSYSNLQNIWKSQFVSMQILSYLLHLKIAFIINSLTYKSCIAFHDMISVEILLLMLKYALRLFF